jgi:DNA-binding protein H-NS
MEEDVKKSDIETMNFKQLSAFVQQASTRMLEMREQELQTARQKVQEMCEELGVTSYQLLGIPEPQPQRGRPKGTNGSKAPARPKYLLPNGETYSGKGRIPLVLREALKDAEGWDAEMGQFDTKEARQKALEPFLIDK